MITYTNTSPRVTATAFAAALLGTALVFAIPETATAATTDGFVAKVERQLKSNDFNATGNGIATIAANVAADGSVRSMTLVGSTGNSALDRQAMRTAKAVAWPAGKDRKVAVVLTFNEARKPSPAATKALVARYTNVRGEALAQQTPAPNAG